MTSYSPRSHPGDGEPALTTPSRFPLLRVAGTAREVGRAHGERFAEHVRASVDVYRDALGGSTHPAWPSILRACHDARARITDLDRALADELAGIAEGADLDPAMVILLSIRADLLRRRDALDDLVPAECTTLSCLATATRDGHTLMAQNWDKLPGTFATTIVVDLQVEDDPRLVTVTEAGVLMHHGFNDRGLGIAGNALACQRDVGPLVGVPTGVARRRAMRHSNLEAAADELIRLPRDISGNHLLASAADAATVDLEVIPGEAFAVTPNDGVLIHTNHFTSATACQMIDDRMAATNSSTRSRLATAEASVNTAVEHGGVDVPTLQALLRSHDAAPDSICKHPDPSGQSATVTVSSTVMDLDTATLFVAPGPACQHEFTEIHLTTPVTVQRGTS